MIASNLMTPRVITANADASVRAVARLLLENGIGAVPVLDGSGVPIGMASDGDLLGRRPEDYRRDWWLEMLADAALSRVSSRDCLRPVREVMTTPLISVDPDASAAEIAALLQTHRIKRLPVIRGGKLVGIVSRTDLLDVVEHLRAAARAGGEAGVGLLRFLESLAGGAPLASAGPVSAGASAPADAAPPSLLSAEAFRERAHIYEAKALERAAAAKRAANRERQRQADALLQQHVSDEAWRKLIERAELAARHGEAEFLLHRFPCDLCTDGGRMIDVAERGWEATLRGEPAELVDRWRSELKPKGFGLSARIVSYVDGVLGDVGLFLTWGR